MSYQRSTSFKTGSANHPIASASTNHSHDVIWMTAQYERSGRRDANHIDTMPPENKTRQELPATVRSTVPMTKCPYRTVLPNSNYSEDNAAWGVKLGSL